MAELGSTNIYGDLDVKNNDIKQVRKINNVTDTELANLEGITSKVQTQLNGKASNAISITAGNGLTGGGTLAGTRTITLGTPTTVTNTTTNSVTSTGHTHALSLTKADITALGIPAQDTVYTHPSTHPASIITESATKRFVSDTEKTNWSNKWDYNESTIKAIKVNNASDADTVNGKTVLSDVPLNAKFTDTIVDIRGKADKAQVLTDVPANAKFTDTIYAHPPTHPASMITGLPTKLPADGGNANTVGGFTVGVSVPANAKFTDTNTITTINGKTGAIAKADIVALGIPASDTNTTYTAGTGLTLTGTVFTPTFGTTAGTVTQGNDSRLSNARTPLAHTHTMANITNIGNVAGVNTNASTTQYLRGDGTWATPPNTNTTYSAMSVAEGTAGTATSSRTVRADYLKQIIQAHSPKVVDNLTTNDATKALSAKQGMALFQSVSDGKQAIATAITGKGVVTSGSDTFGTMAGNIDSLELANIKEVAFRNDYSTLSEVAYLAVGGHVYGVAISPCGKYIAAGSDQAPFFTLLKQERGNLSLASTYTLPGLCHAVAFSPCGGYIAVAHAGSPRFTLLKREGGTLSLAATYTLPYTAYTVSFSPDGQYIAVGYSVSPYFTLLRRDGNTVSLASTYTLSGQCYAVSFSPCGQYIAVGYYGGTRFTLLKREGDILELASTYNVSKEVRGIAFSPDGQYIAVGTKTSTSLVLLRRDGSTVTYVMSYAFTDIGTAIAYSVSFSPDGQYIIIGCSTPPYFVLLKRDGATMTLETTGLNPNKDLYTVAFSPDGQYVAMGGNLTSELILAEAETYSAQPPTVLEYRNKKYYIVEPDDSLRLIEHK